MSRKKRGLARGREIMLDKVHSLFCKEQIFILRNYSSLGVHSPANSLILLLKGLFDIFLSN
jgi:hypothetical protein